MINGSGLIPQFFVSFCTSNGIGWREMVGQVQMRGVYHVFGLLTCSNQLHEEALLIANVVVKHHEKDSSASING